MGRDQVPGRESKALEKEIQEGKLIPGVSPSSYGVAPAQREAVQGVPPAAEDVFRPVSGGGQSSQWFAGKAYHQETWEQEGEHVVPAGRKLINR